MSQDTHYKGHQIVQQIFVRDKHYIITGKKITESDNAKILKAKNGLEDFT